MSARRELIRSTWYVVLGGWLALGLAAAVNWQQWTPVGTILGLTATVVAPALLCLYVHTYRIVIDERGLARRQFWIWQHWPWEDFTAGQVAWDKNNKAFVNRGRPLWNRWLFPIAIPENDIEFLLKLVRSFAEPKQPTNESELAQQPVEMELAWRVFFKLRIDRAGCGFMNGDSWPWSEIAEFRLEEEEVQNKTIFYLSIVTHDGNRRRAFVKLLEARNHLHESVRGDGEEWLDQLRELVPAGCWKCLRISGDLTSLEEGEYRLRKLAERWRALWWIGVITVALSIVFAFCCIIPGLVRFWNVPLLGFGWKLLMTAIALLIVLHAPIILLAVAWDSRRNTLAREAELNRQMAELSGRTVNQSEVAAVNAA